MMGRGPFGLLKTRRSGPKSAKQAKTRLANLLKVLGAIRFPPKNWLAPAGKNKRWL
jgi:hypothetical protein